MTSLITNYILVTCIQLCGIGLYLHVTNIFCVYYHVCVSQFYCLLVLLDDL
jgi:hypothetical protein